MVPFLARLIIKLASFLPLSKCTVLEANCHVRKRIILNSPSCEKPKPYAEALENELPLGKEKHRDRAW